MSNPKLSAWLQTMTTRFAPLYSQNSDGSLQEWTITVQGNKIIRTYGRVGGAVQTTEDVVHSGKNIGRSNETTPEQQAVAEAKSAWEKKQKSGYHADKTAAAAGQVSTKHIAGGIDPMLAHKWSDQSHKIQYPAFMQPKLDGIRCIAIVQNGKCTLWTRTRKPIKSVPHIVTHLEKAFPKGYAVLDGELYNHKYRDRFEVIVSLVRKDKPDPRCDMVQYHVYDAVMQGNFQSRYDWLKRHYTQMLEHGDSVVLVPTVRVDAPDEVIQYFTDWRSEEYEGAMIRNNAEYEHKRSYNIQKIKEFDDAEFKIIGVEPGRGRMAECAVFVCQSKSGEFRCKMEGALDTLKQYLDKPKSVIGKMLTVRYQGLTNGGLPRFPVGVIVRDYE
jgi:ATP-dependent DNA ligase